jgi:glutathione S-transferase
MTDFVDFETARAARGMRLVVLGGVPSPWSEAAKAIFRIKRIHFVVVRLVGKDEAIRAWTGATNAPVAMYADEPPRTGWAEILALAERVAPDPPLLPEGAQERATMLGWAHELLGENGLLWNSRLVGIDAGLASEGTRGFPLPVARYFAKKYGYAKDRVARARGRAQDQVTALGRFLERGGGPYFCGDRLTTLDLYSAAAMGVMAPMPDELCPMMPMLRGVFESMRADIETPDVLVRHRDRVYREHLELPVQL